MNQYFLDQIVLQLKKGFSRIIIDRKNNIVSTSDKVPASGIQVRAGEMNVHSMVQDNAADSPHSVRFREEFRIMKDKPTGPYRLELEPVNDHISCTLIFHPSKNLEEEKALIYKKDFILTDEHEVKFDQSVAKASLFYIDYEVSGTSTTSNFEQEILLDVYDDDVRTAEKYGSLAVSVLLTNQSLLLENFNTLKTGEYGGKRYQSIHRMTSLRWCSSKPQNSENNHRLTLLFQVEGHIQHIRIIDQGIDVIREVPILLEEPK